MARHCGIGGNIKCGFRHWVLGTQSMSLFVLWFLYQCYIWNLSFFLWQKWTIMGSIANVQEDMRYDSVSSLSLLENHPEPSTCGAAQHSSKYLTCGYCLYPFQERIWVDTYATIYYQLFLVTFFFQSCVGMVGAMENSKWLPGFQEVYAVDLGISPRFNQSMPGRLCLRPMSQIAVTHQKEPCGATILRKDQCTWQTLIAS